jgi:hypothetical protein
MFLTAPVIAPNGGVFTNFISITITDAVNGASIFYTLNGSTPTTNSTLYTGPFVLSQSAGIQAMAAMPGSANNPVSVATFINVNDLGRGTGLVGQYYANTFPSNPFVGSPLVRTDAVVSFVWPSGTSPDPSIPPTNYTVRWTGMVQPYFSEPYTFYTTTDDGVRLYVNGQLLIDKWVNQSPTTWNGTISLQGHQLYLIEMDYYQGAGGAQATLSWGSPSTAQGVIPQSQLYPITTLPPVSFIGSPVLNNGIFQVQASGMAGGNYIFQGTTDFLNWVSLSTNLAPSNIFNLIDPAATNFSHRFYRTFEP